MPPVEHHKPGLRYWRSIEQLSGTPEMRALVEREFADDDPQRAPAGLSRRYFLRLAGASLALAGLTLSGCRRWPKEKLAPYSSNPGRLPGVPEQYATVMELGGVAMPLLVSSVDGRPIKIEGNPSHPLSRTADSYGSADAYAQASVLELYDPDRSRYPIEHGEETPQQRSWGDVRAMFGQHFGQLKKTGGAGFAILCESTSSPSVADMRQRLLKLFPQARWHEYEPLSRDNEIQATKLAFGQPLRPILKLDKADVVVLFDEDLLGSHPARVRYAADWAARRRTADQGAMNRLYLAESTYSITGAVADQRLPIRPSRLPILINALAAKLGVGAAQDPVLTADERAFIDSAAADLQRSSGRGVVAAGEHLSPDLHATVFAINAKINAIGQTLSFVSEPDRATHVDSIRALAADLTAGRVHTLLILGGNPSYDAPADLDFDRAIRTAAMSIHLSLYRNETSIACRWHLPRAHYLESWGDARAWDGSISVQQPLIEPIFGGKSIIELLAMISEDSLSDGYRIVRRTFEPLLGSDDFEKKFRRVLYDGVLMGSVPRAASLPVPSSAPTRAAGSLSARVFPEDTGTQAASGFEIRFFPSAAMYDGRFANNGWLQELPDSITKLTWDNAALINKKDADSLGIKTGDVVKLTLAHRSLEIAAYILPGQPAGVIGLPLGYGRKAAGNIGNDVGFNTYALRTSASLHTASGASLQKTGRIYLLVGTQDHNIIDEAAAAERARRIGVKDQSGPLIREASLAEYARDRSFVHRDKEGVVHLQLFQTPSKFNEPHAWGMAIDMNSCIGCNACVVACQAENNVPIVGKEQVHRGREMHWIRIDRYFKGSLDDPNPEVAYQPMMCQQCETAPCEQVCPVGATMHDTEGLNAMVYNRCVGTRYCANNCPYKVRRFNFLDFHSQDPRGTPMPWLGMPDTQQSESVNKLKRMVFNPEVTVRMRGVMEKCTYCVQRIKAAQIDKRNRSEELKDGDIVTACQQACPTQAIIFGDLNDPNAKVSRLHKNNRAYGVLDELNTRPRTQYLAKIRNPAET